ncbi:hypothetical protein [uncultured Hyphomonas sp.]|uniref:hypothetical protein n=1 Tax=uncultured Hyphomonas sp. TaxID=225298 RepID=UPI002AAB723B|nr:hypothetical protein [uncultured Hyphomonas sp.]
MSLRLVQGIEKHLTGPETGFFDPIEQRGFLRGIRGRRVVALTLNRDVKTGA